MLWNRSSSLVNSYNRARLNTVLLGEKGGDNVTLSRKTFWIGAGLVALVVLSVVLVIYSGGGSGGVGGGY